MNRLCSLPLLLGLITLSCLLTPRLVHAMTPVILTGPDLKPEQVTLQSLHDGVMTYFDTDRNLQSRPLREFFRLAPARDDTTADAARPAKSDTQVVAEGLVVWLNDGQTFTANTLHPANADGDGDADADALTFDGTPLGSVQVSLERLWAIDFTGSRRPPQPSPDATDRLRFANGDVTKGFLLGLDRDHARLELETGQSLHADISRLQRITLANPPAGPQHRDHLIELRDGSRIRGRALHLRDHDTLELSPALKGATGRLALPWARIRRINIAQEDYQLLDALDLGWRSLGGGEVFGLPLPPRADRGENRLWLHAPVAVALPLPAGAVRFAADVELVDDPQAWADLVLRVVNQNRVVETIRLNADNRAQRINLPVSGLRVLIALDPAVNGPLRDRVWLINPVVLIER